MNYDILRNRMVETIRSVYGFEDEKVLNVMSVVPRHKFLPKNMWQLAYEDCPVLIGAGQTMSQPYTVAFMTHLLLFGQVGSVNKVLEIGTGSGYQAAVLSRLVENVYTIEIVSKLAKNAKKNLSDLGYKNVHVKLGSGEDGWMEKSPFDGIIVTAGVEGEVPEALFDQLLVGGCLVAPVGRGKDKKMTRFVKDFGGDIKKREYGKFSFVPFVRD